MIISPLYTPVVESTSDSHLWVREEMLRAPELMIRRRTTQSLVALDFQHEFTKDMVGCWPLWQGSPMYVRDLTGNGNHAYGSYSTKVISPITGVYGRTIATKNNDTASARLTLGSIVNANPLNCNANNQVSVFCFGAVTNTSLNNGFPRLIDKSNGSGGSSGWAMGMAVGTAADPDHTFYVSINGTRVAYADNLLGTVNTDYCGKVNGFGVACASGDSNAYWFGEEVQSGRSGSFTIPTTTTDAALLNWNHASDRIWGYEPVYYIAVWNKKMPAEVFRSLHLDPYQIFRPA